MAAVELGFEQRAPGATIHNYGDALWWALVTVTTVGYGDKFPLTAGGRGVAVVLMLTGIGLIGALTATVASFFVDESANRDQQRLEERLDRIEMMLARALGQSSLQPVDGPVLRQADDAPETGSHHVGSSCYEIWELREHLRDDGDDPRSCWVPSQRTARELRDFESATTQHALSETSRTPENRLRLSSSSTAVHSTSASAGPVEVREEAWVTSSGQYLARGPCVPRSGTEYPSS